MEEKLKRYMDELFRDVPDTEQAREVKEEILQNITDKYHDLLQEGKSEEAAYNIAVEGIGDLSELLQSLKNSASGVSDEYKRWKEKSAIYTALAVMLFILSVVPVMLCGIIGINEDIGCILLFLFVAAGVGLLVYNSMTKPDYNTDRKGTAQANRTTASAQYNQAPAPAKKSHVSALKVVLIVFCSIFFACIVFTIISLLPFGSHIFEGIGTYPNAGKYTAGNVRIRPDAASGNALSELHVDWIGGTVRVEGVEGLDQIEIIEENSSEYEEEKRVHSYYHNGVLDVRSAKSTGFFHFFGFNGNSQNKNLVIRIPMPLAENLEELTEDTVSADVTISGIGTKWLNVDTVSGNVEYDGHITDELSYDTVSGDGKFRLISTPKEISTDTVSGDITVALPSSASFDAEFDTVSGDMNCGFPVQKDKGGDFRCGTGDSDFSFDSVSGDVDILAAQ